MARRGRGSSGRACLTDGCERTVRPGHVVCVDCRRTGRGRDLERAVARLADELGQAAEGEASKVERRKRTARAVKRLAMSEEGILVAERLEELRVAARAERALGDERDLRRAAMRRLMAEEAKALGEGGAEAADAAAELARLWEALSKDRRT